MQFKKYRQCNGQCNCISLPQHSAATERNEYFNPTVAFFTGLTKLLRYYKLIIGLIIITTVHVCSLADASRACGRLCGARFEINNDLRSTTSGTLVVFVLRGPSLGSRGLRRCCGWSLATSSTQFFVWTYTQAYYSHAKHQSQTDARRARPFIHCSVYQR